MNKANPEMILFWANRKKCRMCNHKESVGHILPSSKILPAGQWLFHYHDTHGFPVDFSIALIIHTVYGFPLTLTSLAKTAVQFDV